MFKVIFYIVLAALLLAGLQELFSSATTHAHFSWQHDQHETVHISGISSVILSTLGMILLVTLLALVTSITLGVLIYFIIGTLIFALFGPLLLPALLIVAIVYAFIKFDRSSSR
ncbi:hypothetical protein [Algibacillus agarilyticus]|uniref:hypothetical protein n=1 Tax=Algibacillus agarilyticus TaxID=2234133 RepID=UPI000DCFA635|nr:hypothetical protein [Algibacillus agarilyticus]